MDGRACLQTVFLGLPPSLRTIWLHVSTAVNQARWLPLESTRMG